MDESRSIAGADRRRLFQYRIEGGSTMQLGALRPSELDTLCGEGLALHQVGRLGEASQVYETVLAVDPAHFQALHLMGVVCIQTGRVAEGAALIERALEVQPNDTPALGNLATALNRLGRHSEAAACCDRAIPLQPTEASLHGNRGAALHTLGRLTEALDSYDMAVALRPDHAKGHFNRGVVLYALGRLDEALAAQERALTLQPGLAEAHRSAGLILRGQGKTAEALANYDAALAAKPNYAEAHCARANVLCDLKRPAEALEAYDRALALRPEYAEAWSNRTTALRDLGRPEEALRSSGQAITLEPDNAEAHTNRGTALYEFQRLNEALASLDRAIALDPRQVTAHINRAVILSQKRRLDAAMASFDQAIALKPDDPEANFHQAMCRLTLGDEAAGWRQYEARWRTKQFEDAVRDFAIPLWLGDQNLRGQSILVHAEQGLGDALQFCRYVPALADRGARVAFEVYPGLARLMTRLAGAEAVLIRGAAPSRTYDFHVPLMSLPLALGVWSHEHSKPYLSADPTDVAAWAQRIAGVEGLRVGICWAGGARPDQPIAHAIDLRRSLPLAAFRPLADLAHVRLFNLQKGPPAAQLSEAYHWPGAPIVDLTQDLKDFADTAALIENLDLVISCDTSTVHLAGALGKPVWILNRFDSCWRWGHGRDDTPWYPTARLFNQTQPGDWAGVIDKVMERLLSHTRAH